MLPYNFNSGWSASTWQGGTIWFWVQPSAVAPWSLFGSLACCPTPALSLCYFSCLCSLRIWLLAPSLFSGANSAFYCTSVGGVRLQFTVYVFLGFFWEGEFSLPRGCAEFCSHSIDSGVVSGVCCSPVGSADLPRQFWNWLALLFSGRCFLGVGSAWWGIGRLSTG
jgi:hypothetical protein